MKENTVKVLSGVCVVLVCAMPTVQEASEFNFIEDNSTKIENVSESCSFSFVPGGSIGIKTNR